MWLASVLSIIAFNFYIYAADYSIIFFISLIYAFIDYVYGPLKSFPSFFSFCYNNSCLFFIFSNLYFFRALSNFLKSYAIYTFIYFLYFVVGAVLNVAFRSTVKNYVIFFFNLFFIDIWVISLLVSLLNIFWLLLLL